MAVPTLVFLHGFLGDAAEWQPLMAHLPARLRSRCLCLTLPGHGNPGSAACSFAAWPAWLDNQLRQAGVDDYLLYGYSLGARLALVAAASGLHAPRPAHDAYQGKGPHRCALILESGHPGLTSAAERRARASHDARWVQRLRHEPIPRFLESWYRQAVFSDLDEQERQQLIARRRQQDGRRLARMLAATSLARQPDLRPWLKNNLAPLLYLSGERDEKFTALGQQLAATCPTLEHNVLTGAGHNLHLSRPEALAARLSLWLDRHHFL